ncbi:ankyrin repeat domain-containing protein [Flavobacterium gyeonganense]|uniref:Ankyrin repeat domain-containing protein n=1 Tax=Flavobacterium gyeonganense TaxID=1310418 RepID=A0ABV5H8U2_9FLAO|nr:ankyrin repeat domain-containing protein [Flavobacterium gyeonganense]
MKKSIVYLGVALVAFTNVSLASDFNSSNGDKKVKTESYDASPLNVAILKGDLQIVLKFIEYGADVNQISEDMTPLMTAARYNKVEIVKILLAQGAKPGIKNEKGFTALKYAELSNAAEVVAILKGLK